MTEKKYATWSLNKAAAAAQRSRAIVKAKAAAVQRGQEQCEGGQKTIKK